MKNTLKQLFNTEAESTIKIRLLEERLAKRNADIWSVTKEASKSMLKIIEQEKSLEFLRSSYDLEVTKVNLHQKQIKELKEVLYDYKRQVNQDAEQIKELKESAQDFMNEFDYDEEHYKVVRLKQALK